MVSRRLPPNPAERAGRTRVTFRDEKKSAPGAAKSRPHDRPNASDLPRRTEGSRRVVYGTGSRAAGASDSPKVRAQPTAHLPGLRSPSSGTNRPARRPCSRARWRRRAPAPPEGRVGAHCSYLWNPRPDPDGIADHILRSVSFRKRGRAARFAETARPPGCMSTGLGPCRASRPDHGRRGTLRTTDRPAGSSELAGRPRSTGPSSRADVLAARPRAPVGASPAGPGRCPGLLATPVSRTPVGRWRSVTARSPHARDSDARLRRGSVAAPTRPAYPVCSDPTGRADRGLPFGRLPTKAPGRDSTFRTRRDSLRRRAAGGSRSGPRRTRAGSRGTSPVRAPCKPPSTRPSKSLGANARSAGDDVGRRATRRALARLRVRRIGS